MMMRSCSRKGCKMIRISLVVACCFLWITTSASLSTDTRRVGLQDAYFRPEGALKQSYRLRSLQNDQDERDAEKAAQEAEKQRQKEEQEAQKAAQQAEQQRQKEVEAALKAAQEAEKQRLKEEEAAQKAAEQAAAEAEKQRQKEEQEAEKQRQKEEEEAAKDQKNAKGSPTISAPSVNQQPSLSPVFAPSGQSPGDSANVVTSTTPPPVVGKVSIGLDLWWKDANIPMEEVEATVLMVMAQLICRQGTRTFDHGIGSCELDDLLSDYRERRKGRRLQEVPSILMGGRIGSVIYSEDVIWTTLWVDYFVTSIGSAYGYESLSNSPYGSTAEADLRAAALLVMQLDIQNALNLAIQGGIFDSLIQELLGGKVRARPIGEEDGPPVYPNTYKYQSFGWLKSLGILLLIMTCTAYGVLIFLAEHRRAAMREALVAKEHLSNLDGGKKETSVSEISFNKNGGDARSDIMDAIRLIGSGVTKIDKAPDQEANSATSIDSECEESISSQIR